MMRKIILFFLIIICVIGFSNNDSNQNIRLRIIPNSNSEKDVAMKELVKNNIDSFIVDNFDKNLQYEDYQKIIKKSVPELDKNINNIFLTNNYNMSYSINYGMNYFPEKTVEDKTYKDGYYESLVVKIGEGKGDNWWCFLFPPLCLLEAEDETHDKVKVKFFLKNLFN